MEMDLIATLVFQNHHKRLTLLHLLKELFWKVQVCCYVHVYIHSVYAYITGYAKPHMLM